MDEKEVSSSFFVISDANSDRLYPMFFGVSFAFFALKLLPEPNMCDDKWSEIRNRMLQGSAHLLGLLVWRVKRAEKEIEELKKLRREDAKANEKVVSIFAAQEQTWFIERRKLKQQIVALVNELRALEMMKDKTIAELNGKLQECDVLMESKDKSIADEENKRRELEEKVRKSESLVEELTENSKREISKHKTAFIELVSNQRQLEAEMGRAVRQVEVAKQELKSIQDQKEQSILMTQKLSFELVKMQKDLEQKDQILSAMLRKSRLDTAEKQMLLDEVKLSKSKRKQLELETARWKTLSELKHERHSLRNMFSKHVNSKSEIQFVGFTSDIQHTGNRVQSEAEKCKIATEERHHIEIDAFAEQLRLKDEKIEALRWRLLSMEMESKRFQSHVERLDHELGLLRQDNLRLETRLLKREAELHSLKEQLALLSTRPDFSKVNVNSPLHELSISHDTVWSKVKVVTRKPGKKEQETKMKPEALSQDVAVNVRDENIENRHTKEEDIILTLTSPQKEMNERDIVSAETSTSTVKGVIMKTNPTWRVDLYALGVSYKIKRLKQQLLMLERLTGDQESREKGEIVHNGQFGIKGFSALMLFLNKQVDRYQSLQGKTDDICKRMHENALDFSNGSSKIARTEEETKRLEHFLEETFQLQRYIVATGQKLMEVQTKIASSFIEDVEDIEKPISFDVKRFADTVRSLFREVQRGLEVRISRLIGDLEGTLACDSIVHFQK